MNPSSEHTPGGEKRRWVLVAEGGDGESRACVAAVRALAARGYLPAVTVSGRASLAASSRYCAKRVPAPMADEEGFAEALRAETASGRYLTTLAASDAALIALGAPVGDLLDKQAWAGKARSLGLKTPPTMVFESRQEVLAAAGTLDYPVVVKPAVKRYAASRVEGPGSLAAALAGEGRVIVQPFLSEPLHGILGLAWKGEVVGATHMSYVRTWPYPCGTVASAVSVEPDRKLEERLAALLGSYEGLFHADLAGGHLLDVNPRIHATLPLAMACGVDLVGSYCDLLSGKPVPQARGRPGVRFRWLEGDLRSIARAWRLGHMQTPAALAALVPQPGTVHSFGDWSDPGPMLTRAGMMARRVASAFQRRDGSH